MPMRVMGYDYGTYKKQYDDNAKKYKNANGMSRDEYMSKMKKMDKFIPVITIKSVGWGIVITRDVKHPKRSGTICQ